MKFTDRFNRYCPSEPIVYVADLTRTSVIKSPRSDCGASEIGIRVTNTNRFLSISIISMWCKWRKDRELETWVPRWYVRALNATCPHIQTLHIWMLLTSQCRDNRCDDIVCFLPPLYAYVILLFWSTSFWPRFSLRLDWIAVYPRIDYIDSRESIMWIILCSPIRCLG